MGLCLDSMSYPHGADRARNPVWKGARNILSTQSWTADKRLSFSLRFGRGVNKSSPSNIAILRNVHHCLGLGLILWYNPSKEKGRDMRFSAWNVRKLCRAGSHTAVARELVRYKLALAGVQRVRWDKRALEGRRIIFFSMEKKILDRIKGFYTRWNSMGCEDSGIC